MEIIVLLVVVTLGVLFVRVSNARMVMGKYERRGYSVSLSDSGLWHVSKEGCNWVLTRDELFFLSNKI